jgi:hypothetical protein
LKDFVNGKLLFCKLPPTITEVSEENQEKLEQPKEKIW